MSNTRRQLDNLTRIAFLEDGSVKLTRPDGDEAVVRGLHEIDRVEAIREWLVAVDAIELDVKVGRFQSRIPEEDPNLQLFVDWLSKQDPNIGEQWQAFFGEFSTWRETRKVIWAVEGN